MALVVDESLWDHLSSTAAQSKRPGAVEAPAQQPMRAGLKPAQRRAPTTDQKKHRRLRNKTALTQDTCPQCHSEDVTVHDNHSECHHCGFTFESDTGDEYEDPRSHRYHDAARHPRTSPAPYLYLHQHANKESAMTQSIPTEADLVTRLAAAATLAEQADLSAQIEAVRAARRESIARESSMDWDAIASPTAGYADFTRTTLPPLHTVASSVTDATDWLDAIVPTRTEDAVVTASMRAQATLWYQGLWDAVKQDAEEFSVQTENAARRAGAAFGLQSTAAASVFSAQVEHLHKKADKGDGVGTGTCTIDRCQCTKFQKDGTDHQSDNGPLCKNCEHTVVAHSGTGTLSSLHKKAEWGTDPYAAPQGNVGTPTYVSDGKTTQPVGVDPAKADTFDEDNLGGTNPDDPKSTGDKGQGGIQEGSSPEGAHSEPADKSESGGTGLDKSQWQVGNTDDKMKTQSGTNPLGPQQTHAPYCPAPHSAGPCTCGTDFRSQGSAHTAALPDWAPKTCPACGGPQKADGSGYAHKKGANCAEGKTSAYGGGSPKHGDTAKCHKDGGAIQFFDGQWMHLKGTGSAHNDVYPNTPKEQADKDKKQSAKKKDSDSPADQFYLTTGMEGYGGRRISGPHTYADAKAKMRTIEGPVNLMQGTHPLLPKETHEASLFDSMASFFGTETRGIETYSAQHVAGEFGDGTGSAAAATEAPSVNEGSTPESDHSESPVQEPGQGASDKSGPTDSDLPGGGVNWGTSGGAATSQDGAYTARLSPNAQVFVATLSRMATLDDSIAGVSGHQLVSLLLADETVPTATKTALRSTAGEVPEAFKKQWKDKGGDDSSDSGSDDSSDDSGSDDDSDDSDKPWLNEDGSKKESMRPFSREAGFFHQDHAYNVGDRVMPKGSERQDGPATVTHVGPEGVTYKQHRYDHDEEAVAPAHHLKPYDEHAEGGRWASLQVQAVAWGRRHYEDHPNLRTSSGKTQGFLATLAANLT